MLSFLCTLLLPVMSAERCYRRKNMPEQTPSPVEFPPELPDKSAALVIDYFSQARKALSERSPFDVVEETSTSAAVTLPSGLASLLNRHNDNRRRQKKSNSGGCGGGGGDKKKKSSKAGEKLRGFNIWIETEDYFRDLNLSDIDNLLEASSSAYSLGSREYFTIPRLGNNDSRFNVVSSENEKKSDSILNVVSSENEKNDVEEVNNENGSLGIELSDVVALERALPNDNCDSLEWFLGCRNKIPLASERPSKKRKLLGSDAGLEKVIMTSPCDGDKPYCHYCGKGDSGTDSNRLIVCSSCKVAVHRKCYGIQDEVDGSWLCSWCKQKSDVDDSASPCILCSKKGGALKPVNSDVEGVGSAQFVHLFCSLWMPEVYIDDLKKMEPVMNVGSIKETRKKLVCNVCKLRCGACVRCSHGSCRTPFHPLCAREARHRLEVWAKYGNDNIELRAFCLKHSDLQENRNTLPLGGSTADGSEFPESTMQVESEHNLKVGCSNGSLECDSNPDKLNHNDGHPDEGLSVSRISAHNRPPQMAGRTNANVNACDSPSFVLVLKKLIDLGKVDVKDVALEIGISPDALTANINEAYMTPDMQHKIVNWLKAHVYTGAFHKGIKVKFKPANASMDECGASDGSDTLPISESGSQDPVAVNVKSVPPRRRTINNIRILKDNKVICSSDRVTSENGVSTDKFLICQPKCENPGSSNEASIHGATETNLAKSEDIFHEVQGNADGPHKSEQNASMLSDQHEPAHSASEPPFSGFIKMETISSYIHPYIHNKLLQVRDGLPLEDIIGLSGYRNSLVESSGAIGCSGNENQQLICTGVSKPDQVKMEQLVRDEKMRLMEFYSEDELEGELVYFQYRLLHKAVAKKRITENLVRNVAKSLPQEIDKTHQQRWDAVIANQYLRNLREVKKQGRKEKRNKEAQAVLAAATAAAAASSRVSSFRKDAIDESVQQENSLKLDALSGRTGACSQPMPRAKETLSRVAVTRASSEKFSDFCLPSSDLSKEQRKSCDICRRFENILNPILVCAGCKVAVHSVCYRSVKETTGPWYCELCEDLLSKGSGASAINSWEKPFFVAECALCGGTTGAFRKSSNDQWVHAFCAEWLFESTFRRGQIDAIRGMDTVPKGVDICCICHRKHGVCMKCCYGHCLTTFHPSCARSAGLFMIVRTAGGKMQHKAYCEKHSSEQRAKAETQKHGVDDLKNVKQIRVELERLRLLCERIVKREKIKRELVLCSHDILAFKRDHAARSVLVHSPFVLPDGSSESATTSLKATTEGYRSCSEALQRSDDVTVDSSVSAKHRVRVAVSMDTDPKLDDDCSTSQSHYNHKIPEKMQFSGKQIPRRASATIHNVSEEDGWRSKSRKLQTTESFGKELVMTSDEASMKNSRLPKGYAYVPADCLSNDKQSNEDVYGSGPGEPDG